jgi:hypothetical protein
MFISKSILTASALLVAAALLCGAILIPLAYDKLVVKVVLKDGPEVTVDASRGEK